MYIEISKADDGSGKNVVKILHDDHSTGSVLDMTITTAHVVSLEVAADARVNLARSRTNGTQSQVAPNGDVWLTGHKARLDTEIIQSSPLIRPARRTRTCHAPVEWGEGTKECGVTRDATSICPNAGNHVGV